MVQAARVVGAKAKATVMVKVTAKVMVKVLGATRAPRHPARLLL